MCTILTPLIFTENWGCQSKASRGHIQKNYQKMPGIYQNLDFNSTVYKMLKNWGFSPCLIIYLQQRYWECGVRGALALPSPPSPMQGCSPPLLSQYYNGLFHKKKQTGWGWGVWGHTFLKTPMNFQVFALPLNSKLIKPSPLETPENCVTPHRNLKA